jgi:hypothetical protein
MPNSRIEVAPNLNSSIIGEAGGWVTTGNILGAGGGSKLGSLDNFGWNMIVNNTTRAGLKDDGSFFISESEFFPDRHYRHLVRSVNTSDDVATNIYTFPMPDKRCYALRFNLVYIAEDNSSYGMLERSVMLLRNGASMNLSQETFHKTEKVGNKSIDGKFKVQGTNLVIEVVGDPSETIKFNALINYHGIRNF